MGHSVEMIYVYLHLVLMSLIAFNTIFIRQRIEFVVGFHFEGKNNNRSLFFFQIQDYFFLSLLWIHWTFWIRTICERISMI